MFKPKIGDVLDCANGLIILIVDANQEEDVFTWRFLPSEASPKEQYGTAGRYFRAHSSPHKAFGSYALIFNVFDDIDWGEIHARTKSA